MSQLAKADSLFRTQLGRTYLGLHLNGAALEACKLALTEAGTPDSMSGLDERTAAGAKTCLEAALRNSALERSPRLSSELDQIDQMSPYDPDRALLMIATIREKLFPIASGVEIDKRNLQRLQQSIDRANSKQSAWPHRMKRVSSALRKTPGLLLHFLEILLLFLALAAIMLAVWHLSKKRIDAGFAFRDGDIKWTVWSISDPEGRGAAGAVMDALDWESNPLLSDYIPSSLLLYSPDDDRTNGLGTPKAWKDLLDEPRTPIDMEVIKKSEFRRHKFVQTEAFEEMDLKIGSIEAKGLLGGFRNLHRMIMRGLPASQGVVYSSTEGAAKKTHACVRITCNWPDSPAGIPDTVSVYASTEDDPRVDAIGLSAQRAAFKLFYRLAQSELPEYSSAVANFHQGVRLIERSI